MSSLIEPSFKSNLIISPTEPIYKTAIKKQPYQNKYLPNRKTKELFKEILDKEISKQLGSKISVRI
ncbi:MAG: hypothetical protein H6Q68_2578 [Firmicutes bacterium]|nr:hypothetical protein [Bacillota bacterium]